MRLLSDTQAFLWFSEGSPRLPATARLLLEDPANQVFVSMASVWEIAIKVGIGKFTLTRPLEQFLIERLDGNEFEILPIERAHILRLVGLPLHHRDPFDRLLVAQCLAEGLPLVSVDTVFDTYGVQRLCGCRRARRARRGGRGGAQGERGASSLCGSGGVAAGRRRGAPRTGRRGGSRGSRRNRKPRRPAPKRPRFALLCVLRERFIVPRRFSSSAVPSLVLTPGLHLS
jgi:PIN domain nuclease of toxin-antitoxin system